MASNLLSQQVKNLVQGISQQPPFVRYAEQLEEQVNGYSTEVDGLQKRPPTKFIKSLTSLWGQSWTNPNVHYINRDTNERYCVIFGNNTIKVFTLDGEERTVNITDPNYLKVTNPRTDLQIITVADYSFVLNKTITTKMTSDMTPNSFSTQGSLVYVKQGQYGRTYTIYIDGVAKGTYTTPDGSQASHATKIDTSYIANQLATSLQNSGISFDHEKNWIRIRTTGKVNTADGFNNQSLISFSSQIQRFSNLPAYAPDGYTVKVIDDPNGGKDASYYVKYDNAHSVWVECVAPNIPYKIDATTMPHVLIREADDTFSFKPWTWDDRRVGDEDSNPLPTFIDNTLSSIFFYRNRLGVTSISNVIMSENGVYSNMWLTTANDVLDTDCIDVSLAGIKSNIITSVLVYSEDLYAFTIDTQFILRTSTVLSPKYCTFAEITQFNSSPTCMPKVSGKNLYFIVDRGSYSSLNEYYTVQDVSSLKNAQDISSHVPNFIPDEVYKIIPSTIINILLLLSTRSPSRIYVYKYLFSNESRVQSSWSYWEFKDTIIWGADFIGNTLYLVMQRGSSVNLESISFASNIIDLDNEPYRTYFDCKIELPRGTFDASTHLTTFNLLEKYGYQDISPLKGKQFDIVTSKGKYISNCTINDKGILTLEEDYSDATLHIFGGIAYTFSAKLSTLYVRSSSNSGDSIARTDGRTQIKYINLQYDTTGYFKVDVTQDNGSVYTYIMNSRMLGTASAKLGDIQDDTGVFRFPIQAQNTSVTITITSDFPLPLALVGMSYECRFTTKVRG